MRRTMTKEEKELLLKDLCARLPYKVLCQYEIPTPEDGGRSGVDEGRLIQISEDMVRVIGGNCGFSDIKPYLRPMTSMTEEEKTFYEYHKEGHCSAGWAYALVDWLNAHHFDYRGLIERGLALEAPEGMYN